MRLLFKLNNHSKYLRYNLTERLERNSGSHIAIVHGAYEVQLRLLWLVGISTCRRSSTWNSTALVELAKENSERANWVTSFEEE